MVDLITKEYYNWLGSLKQRIQEAQIKAALRVNGELIELYWILGTEITRMEQSANWGDKLIATLSKDLMSEFPGIKGFSMSNLKYIRRWYLAYNEYIRVGQQAVAQLDETVTLEVSQQAVDQLDLGLIKQIPWGHHIAIVTKTKGIAEAIFYLKACIQNNWSRSVLIAQIETRLYDRQGKSLTNFSSTLPVPLSDLAQETLKNPFNFDFLTLTAELKERDLERGLIEHLKQFMLELGKGFAYVGNQFHLDIAGDDFFLDLLFYNTILHSYVIFELKLGEFKAEYAGKMNFYINCINDKIKGQGHNPTIGVLLCRTPNETVVQFALQGIDTPLGISEYQLAHALPKELEQGMPTIEEIEMEIEKEIEELKNPVQKKIESLKERIATLKTGTIETPVSTEHLRRIHDSSIVPLFAELLKHFEEIDVFFMSKRYNWTGTPVDDFESFKRKWGEEEFHKSNKDLHFKYQFYGFKRAGVEPFDIQIRINYVVETYRYSLQIPGYNEGWPVIKKLYHQDLSPKEINDIIDAAMSKVLRDIENHVSAIENK